MTLDNFFSHWKQIRNDLLVTIDKFSEEELLFVPFESSMSVGEIMLHIANAEEGWFRYVVTQELSEWPAKYTIQKYPIIGAIKNLLTEVHGRTEANLSSLDISDLDRSIAVPWSDSTLSLGWIIWHVLEHEIHHRGELSLILGFLGREGLDV